MGTKYTTIAISGYNASPPADDGTETESNKVKWSTIKTKLPDPIKTRQDAIDTALVAFADLGPVAKSTAYTTTTADHLKTIEVTGTTTITLGAVGSMGAGYKVTIRNVGVATVTVDGSTTETIDGDLSFTLAPKQSVTVQVDAVAGGYITTSSTRAGITDTATSSQIAITDAAVTITPAVTFSGALTASSGGSLTGTWSDLGTVTTVDINGGTADGVTIGGTTPAAATFTTLTANTSITGTLATAAQPNITSLGTITGFTSTGIDDNATATQLTITDTGVGIGVTPEAWTSGYTATQIGNAFTIMSNTTGQDSYILSNAYNDDLWKYQTTAAASQIKLASDGSYIFFTAPSGTADTAITWHQALSIANSGAVTIAAPTSGSALTATALIGQNAIVAIGDSASGNSKGILVKAGTTAADHSVLFQNQAATKNYFAVDGIGNIVCGDAALATTATDGFLYIPSSAGTPTGVPTAKTGRIPIEYDSTNDAIMANNSGWKSYALREDVSGYVKGNAVFLEDDAGAEPTGLAVTTAVTKATWESIGPTGSGATNIWTDMDSIPSNAKWVELRIQTTINGSTSGSTYQTSLHARVTGSATAASNKTWVTYASFTNRSGAQELDSNFAYIKVPLDSSQRFDAYWTNGGTTPTSTINAWVTGWGS